MMLGLVTILKFQRVIINGGCNINKNSFIGSASILKENISIKEQSFIKMGSIIKK